MAAAVGLRLRRAAPQQRSAWARSSITSWVLSPKWRRHPEQSLV
jgi:hypothetical protein